MALDHLLNPDVSARLCLTLAHSWWQFALLATLAYLFGRLPAKRSSERQYAMSVVAMGVGMLALPVTYRLLGPSGAADARSVAQSASEETRAIPHPTRPDVVLSERVPEEGAIRTTAARENVQYEDVWLDSVFPVRLDGYDDEAVSPPQMTQVAPAPFWLRFAPWLVGAYFLGVLFMFVRLVAAFRSAQKLLSHASRVTESDVLNRLQALGRRWSLRVVPLLVHAEQVVVPKIVGLLRPTILLPTGLLTGLSPQELDLILAHELAHLRRHDLAIQLLQRIAEAVLFFNPALWYLSRRISSLREYCCDELTCRSLADDHGEPRQQYALALLRIAELAYARLPASRKTAGNWQTDLDSLAASGRSPSELRRRIASLFGEPLREPLPISRSGMWAMGAIALLALAGPQLWTAWAAEPTPQEEVAVTSASNASTGPADQTAQGLDAGAQDIAPDDSTDIPQLLTADAQIDAVVEHFLVTLLNRKLPFLGNAELSAIGDELRDDLQRWVKRPLPPAAFSEVLLGIEALCSPKIDRVGELFSNVNRFTGEFERFKWYLWTAMDPIPATGEDLARREQQRNWMRDFLRRLPDPNHGEIRTWSGPNDTSIPQTSHQFKAKELEVVMTNALNPFFALPLTAEQFLEVQREIQNPKWTTNSNPDVNSGPSLVCHAVNDAQRDRVWKRWPIRDVGNTTGWLWWDGMGKWVGPSYEPNPDTILARLLAQRQKREQAGEPPPAELLQKPDEQDTPARIAVQAGDRPTGVVEGVLVHAADGSPVADATVILQTEAGRQTTSDSAGRFRFENVPARAWSYRLWARRGNLVSVLTSVAPQSTTDLKVVEFDPLRLNMREGTQATFLVTSQTTQQPVAGATVRFGYPDQRELVTDERGQAIVQGLQFSAAMGRYDVTIEAEGHARSALRIEVERGAPPAVFRTELVTGGVVRGKVVDAAGKPVAGAEIVYRRTDDAGFHGNVLHSDADGNFQYRHVPVDVVMEASAQKQDYVRARQEFRLTANQRETELRLVLPVRLSGNSVSGVVTDESGKPISGADVTNHGKIGEEQRATTTDAEGRFLIDGVFRGPSRYEIGVAYRGFEPQLLEVQPGSSKAPATVSVVLKRGHALRGQVLLDNGQPALGAVVSLRSDNFHPDLRAAHTVDDNGRFRLDSLPEDVRFDVRLAGCASQDNIPLKLDGREPVVVTLELSGRIRGRVIDAATNQPIAPFRIRLGHSRQWKPGEPRSSIPGRWTAPGKKFNSADGAFLVEPLTAGLPVELIVESEGYERRVIPNAIADKGSAARDIEISLVPIVPAKAFKLTGQFLDHQGEPKAGAQLRLIVSTDQPKSSFDPRFNWYLIKQGELGRHSSCEQFLTSITDSSGRFEFTEILPGKYLQLAYWGAGVPQGKSLAFDETQPGGTDDITIRLPAAAKIRGTLARGKFRKAVSLHLSLRDPRAHNFHDYRVAVGNEQETFEFNDLPPGNYSLSIMSDVFRRVDPATGRDIPVGDGLIPLRPGQVETVKFVE